MLCLIYYYVDSDPIWSGTIHDGGDDENDGGTLPWSLLCGVLLEYKSPS